MPGPASISVVIPCYNQGQFLREAIGSVHRQQGLGPGSIVEVVVVDDGSTDDTSAIAAELGTRVIAQPNRGLSVARNVGLAAATGDLIVFLDADDELTPDALATGAEVFQSRAEVACVLRHCLLIDARGRMLPTQPPEDVRRDIYAELLHRNVTWAPGAAMFRRRDVVSAGGFPREIAAAGDYSLYLRFARAGRLVYANMPAVRYRQHDGNMSHDPATMLRSTLRALADESRHVPPSHRRELVAGRRDWCDFYGDQIVDKMRLEWRRQRRAIDLARHLLSLIRYCPHVAIRHARRKLSRVARGLPAAGLDASGRFSPASSRPRGTRR